MRGIPRTDKRRARDGKGTQCLELARHGLCLPKGVIGHRGLECRSRDEREKSHLLQAAATGGTAFSGVVIALTQPRCVSVYRYSGWGTTTWTRSRVPGPVEVTAPQPIYRSLSILHILRLFYAHGAEKALY
jgi:hypothetical protein